MTKKSRYEACHSDDRRNLTPQFMRAYLLKSFQNFCMKKKIISISLFIVFIVAIGAIFYKYKKDNVNKDPEVYTLLPRKGAAAQAPEWLKVKEQGI